MNAGYQTKQLTIAFPTTAAALTTEAVYTQPASAATTTKAVA